MNLLKRRFAQLEETFRESEVDMEAFYKTILERGDPSDILPISQFERIMNVAFFQSHFTRDLLLTLDDLINLPVGWKKTLHARFAALLIVEFMEDAPELLAQEFLSKTRLVSTTAEEEATLKSICKDLNTLRNREDKDLRDIRNTVIGHMDHDVRKQLQYLQNIDIDRITRICSDLVDLLIRLLSFLSCCIARLLRAMLLCQVYLLTRVCLLRRIETMTPVCPDPAPARPSRLP
jgi:hypothetical protein